MEHKFRIYRVYKSRTKTCKRANYHTNGLTFITPHLKFLDLEKLKSENSIIFWNTALLRERTQVTFLFIWTLNFVEKIWFFQFSYYFHINATYYYEI